MNFHGIGRQEKKQLIGKSNYKLWCNLFAQQLFKNRSHIMSNWYKNYNHLLTRHFCICTNHNFNNYLNPLKKEGKKNTWGSTH